MLYMTDSFKFFLASTPGLKYSFINTEKIQYALLTYILTTCESNHQCGNASLSFTPTFSAKHSFALAHE